MDINIRCRDYSGSGDLVMCKEMDITYNFMVGNLYVKSESRKGVEFTTNMNDAYTLTNNDVYNSEPAYHRHVTVIAEFFKKLRRHDIYNVRIVERRVIVETIEIEREVELVDIDNTLQLKEVVEDYKTTALLDDNVLDEIAKDVEEEIQ